MKVFQDDVLTIVEESSKDEVTGLRTLFDVHIMNVIGVLVDELLSWVRIIGICKKRSIHNNN